MGWKGKGLEKEGGVDFADRVPINQVEGGVRGGEGIGPGNLDGHSPRNARPFGDIPRGRYFSARLTVISPPKKIGKGRISPSLPLSKFQISSLLLYRQSRQ